MKRAAILLTGAVAMVTAALVSKGVADPVSETLTIDGVEITTVAPAPSEPEGHPYAEVRSGWLYREADTRAMQMDSFENPGMLNVENGETIWNAVDGGAGQSCASCHENASEFLAGVGATFPRWDEDSNRPINIELFINKHRQEQMDAEPYAFDSPEQKDLTAFIKHQSLGMTVEIDLSEGGMMDWWEKGRERYYLRTGQFDLSCATCHEGYNGRYIRADHLSQGNSNGFPTYRLRDGGLVSLHNRSRGCVRDTRAVIPEAFADDLMALEVYVAWRGSGLDVETPAVRQ